MLKAFHYGVKGYLKDKELAKQKRPAAEGFGVPFETFNQMRDEMVSRCDNSLLGDVIYNRWVEAGKRLYVDGRQPSLEEIEREVMR